MKEYTNEDWERDEIFSPQIGQIIEDDVFWDIIDSCPATYMSPDFAQPGEAERHIGDIALYDTFRHDKEGWRYIGEYPELNNTLIKRLIKQKF